MGSSSARADVDANLAGVEAVESGDEGRRFVGIRLGAHGFVSLATSVTAVAYITIFTRIVFTLLTALAKGLAPVPPPATCSAPCTP